MGLSFALASTNAIATEAPVSAVPVTVGRDGADLDACGAIGKIGGLDMEGDDSLAVYARLDVDGAELGRLNSGTLVWLCDSQDGWQGIVYAEEGKDLGDCRVGSPVPQPEPYRGPCLSGWVQARYVRLVAG